jgi:hypothetical protein
MAGSAISARGESSNQCDQVIALSIAGSMAALAGSEAGGDSVAQTERIANGDEVLPAEGFFNPQDACPLRRRKS